MSEEQRLSRRSFVGRSVSTAAAITSISEAEQAIAQTGFSDQVMNPSTSSSNPTVKIALTVNGEKHVLDVEPRVTLLDALRERLQMTGSKKGCDHGQCGACTVLVDGRRTNSCLQFAVACEGSEVTTVEGLASGSSLHPIQAAFIQHDGFQCGYCTPGQICSAAGLFNEMSKRKQKTLSDEEIQEQMSGNICRCAAYPNIVAAVRGAMQGRGEAA